MLEKEMGSVGNDGCGYLWGFCYTNQETQVGIRVEFHGTTVEKLSVNFSCHLFKTFYLF